MEYKVLKEGIHYGELKEQADEKQQENELLERFLESIRQMVEKVRDGFRR